MKRLIVCSKKRCGVEVVFDKAFDETLTVEQLAMYFSNFSKNVSTHVYDDPSPTEQNKSEAEQKEKISEVME